MNGAYATYDSFPPGLRRMNGPVSVGTGLLGNEILTKHGEITLPEGTHVNLGRHGHHIVEIPLKVSGILIGNDTMQVSFTVLRDSEDATRKTRRGESIVGMVQLATGAVLRK